MKTQASGTIAKCTIGLGLLAGLALAPSASAEKFSEWSEPVNLGPIINTEFDEGHPSISSDELSLYFSSNRTGGFGVVDIWVSRRASVDDPWGAPQNLGPIVNASLPYSTGGPNLSPDDHWLFFSSDRPGGFGSFDIWASHREDIHDDFGWELPANLGPGVNSPSNDGDPTLFVDPETGAVTLYFASLDRPEGVGDWDLYTSTLGDDGTFGPAVLVDELDTPFRETRCGIRRDGLEIIFSSNRPGSLGPIDLWVSTRETTADPWSEPVNLGRPVNTPGFATRAPALSADGTTLYLRSNRPGGFGGDDLYLSTRTKLPD